jgi:hypothetical protein
MNSIGSKTTTQPSQQGNAAALAARDINHIPPIAGEDAVAKSNARQSASRQGSNRTVPQQVMGPWREMNRFPPTPSTATVTTKEGEFFPASSYKSPESCERSKMAPKLPSPPTTRSVPERVMEGGHDFMPLSEDSRIFMDGDCLLFGICSFSDPDDIDRCSIVSRCN